MNPISPRLLLRPMFLAVSVLALATGCATIEPDSKAAEEIVLERAQARWNALVKRDWASAYPFMTPAYRAVVPLDRYGGQFVGPVQWQTAKVHSAKCEDRRCTVSVEISFRLAMKGYRNQPFSTYVDETWVLEDGQWFKFEPL